jgi:hypothetical protein
MSSLKADDGDGDGVELALFDGRGNRGESGGYNGNLSPISPCIGTIEFHLCNAWYFC